MKISEVMELTGLTKKAINYYIQEGLISPDSNIQNNYREFSKEDIDKLAHISVLRQFDVPIKEIKEIIESPEQIKIILEMHLNFLEEEVKRLEISKTVLNSCLRSFDKADISQMTKQMSLLCKSLEMDQKGKEGFIKNQIQRIFPGNFGKMLAISYGPFLNEPINSREKEEAWLSMVGFLDDVEDIEYPDGLKELYDPMPEEEIEKYEKSYAEYIEKWINMTETGMVEERKNLIKGTAQINEDCDKQKEHKKVLNITESVSKLMQRIGYSEGFSKQLKILSEKYAIYIQKMVEFNKGLFFEVDKDGRVIIGEK